MSRIKDLQKQVHKIMKNMDDSQKRAAAIAHLQCKDCGELIRPN